MEYKICRREIKKVKNEIDFLENMQRKRYTEWATLRERDKRDVYFDYVESCLDCYGQDLEWKYDDLHDLIRELMFFYEPGHLEYCQYRYERIW